MAEGDNFLKATCNHPFIEAETRSIASSCHERQENHSFFVRYPNAIGLLLRPFFLPKRPHFNFARDMGGVEAFMLSFLMELQDCQNGI